MYDAGHAYACAAVALKCSSHGSGGGNSNRPEVTVFGLFQPGGESNPAYRMFREKEGTERKTARRGVSTERKHACTRTLKGEREKEREKERIRTSGRLRVFAPGKAKERKCAPNVSFFQTLPSTRTKIDVLPSSIFGVARIRDVVVVPLGFSLSKYISAVFASFFARVFVFFECETKS